MFRTAYSIFRGGLPSLACNEGHYNNTPFVERLCPLCKNGIETEFPNVRTLAKLDPNTSHSFGTPIQLLTN